MKRTVAILTLIGLLAGAVTLVRASDRSAMAALDAVEGDLCVGDNLLANPSFEGEYSTYIPPSGHADCPAGVCTTAQMAPSWFPWWQSNSDLPGDYDRNPEYKPSQLWDQGATGPGDRVRSGEHAQQYFSFYGTHVAGVYQQVTVTPGRTYRFCVWGHSWSAGEYVDYYESNPTIPDNDYASGPQFGIMMQRVGIDPNGGAVWPVNGAITDIVWSSAREQYDSWGHFSVTVTAQAPLLTVYTYSDPMWPVRNNDVYWDDAALVELVDTTMSVAPASGLMFLVDVGEPGPQSQQLRVQFDPDQGYTWSAAIGAGSMIPLSLTPGGGSGDSLSVGVSTAGLGLGTYAATVVITASGGTVGGSPAVIPVTLHVVSEVSESYLPASVVSP